MRLHTPLVAVSLPSQQEGVTLLTAWSWGLHLLGSTCSIWCLWGACPGSVQCQLEALELCCIQQLTLQPGNHGGIFRAQVCYLFWRQCLRGIKAREIGLDCQLCKAGKESKGSTVLHLEGRSLQHQVAMKELQQSLKKCPVFICFSDHSPVLHPSLCCWDLTA